MLLPARGAARCPGRHYGSAAPGSPRIIGPAARVIPNCSPVARALADNRPMARRPDFSSPACLAWWLPAGVVVAPTIAAAAADGLAADPDRQPADPPAVAGFRSAHDEPGGTGAGSLRGGRRRHGAAVVPAGRPRGDALAAYNAAVVRLNDESAEPEEKAALDLLMQSAKRGLRAGAAHARHLYERGQFLPPSQSLAVHWYRLAAEQGDAAAQLSLATQYYLGRGAARDYGEAARWYEKAAQAGDAGAQYIVASMYEQGLGVRPDLDQALGWYTAAARQGDVVAELKAKEVVANGCSATTGAPASFCARAARGFGAHEELARARCVVAEAEVALAMRDFGGSPRLLAAASATLEARADRANALQAQLIAARRFLLLGRLTKPRPRWHGSTPAACRLPGGGGRADGGRAGAALAGHRLRAGGADSRARGGRARTRAGAPGRGGGGAGCARSSCRPALSAGGEQALRLDEVEALLSSGALVVDACRHGLRAGAAWRPLARRPVLFALARALGEAWPGDVDREALIAVAFRTRRPDESHRARLRVEIGRLRALVKALARIEATARGFLMSPQGGAQRRRAGTAHRWRSGSADGAAIRWRRLVDIGACAGPGRQPAHRAARARRARGRRPRAVAGGRERPAVTCAAARRAPCGTSQASAPPPSCSSPAPDAARSSDDGTARPSSSSDSGTTSVTIGSRKTFSCSSSSMKRRAAAACSSS